MKIEWRAAARESLLEIVDYIADDDPGAALALLDDIEQKVAKIPENPFMHRPGRVPGPESLSCAPTTWWSIPVPKKTYSSRKSCMRLNSGHKAKARTPRPLCFH